jgi:CDP-paratose 2-epimerase
MTRTALVTGGAGFIGCNLVNNLRQDGYHVIVFDSLARPGSERNLEWLLHEGPAFEFVHGDVRDLTTLRDIVQDVDEIYHFAAQVAVTTSVENPSDDFDVNARGTFNVLEAARLGGRRPTLVFTSTNKVYGAAEDVVVREQETRYELQERPHGIPESQPLDFHSPYGCSKGAGDQYVRDYARIFDLPTVVFRMSCIYGPRQFGNEDQGWLAHFVIAAVSGSPLTIYGDGKQVRDVLFIDDLVRALRLAVTKIDRTAGQIYNIGGGPRNALAVWREFGPMLERLSGRPSRVSFSDWRPGDQKCYVSDIRKAQRDLGWRPEVNAESGVRHLWEWASAHQSLFEAVGAPAGAVREGAAS